LGKEDANRQKYSPHKDVLLLPAKNLTRETDDSQKVLLQQE